MNSRKQKMKGAAEEVVGKLKAGVGKAIGSAKIKAEGRAVEEKGKSRQEAAKATERAKGTLQTLTAFFAMVERAVRERTKPSSA